MSKSLTLIISIIAVSLCFGQEPDIRIYDFSGGLNMAGLFHVKQNEARDYLNIDPSEKYGALRPRKGYVALTDTLPRDNPLYSIYGYTSRSGIKQLFGITCQMVDVSNFEGLGELVVSAEHTYSLDTSTTAESKFSYIYTGAVPDWATWQDKVIFSNGRQKPISVHNGYACELAIQSPGEISLYPMNDSGDYLNGEYYYLTKSYTMCGADTSDLTNPGFEAWTGDVPDNWTEFSAYGDVTWDTANELGGDTCLLLIVTTNNQDVGVYQNVTLSPNTEYLLSCYVKYISRSSSGLVSLTPSPYSAITTNDTSGSWDLLSINFITNDTDTVIQVQIDNYCVGTARDTAYFDSVTIFGLQDYYDSYISGPYSAYFEKIWGSDFVFHNRTDKCVWHYGYWDDLTVDVYRTKANPDKISEDLLFYRVFHFPNIQYADLEDIFFIDSIPDSDLTVSSPNDTIRPDLGMDIGLMTDTTVSGIRIGAPTYINYNPVPGTALPDVDTSLNDICLVYILTYKDTITNYESDSGRALFIYYDTSLDSITYRIGLPPLPANSENLIRILYKAYGFLVPADTNITGSIIIGYKGYRKVVKSVTVDGKVRWGYASDTIPIYSTDTNLSPFYELSVFKDSSKTEFYDGVPFSELEGKRRIFYPKRNINKLRNIVPFGDRLWGSQGSRLYYSYLDTAGYWSPFDDIALNLDDGDDITRIVPDRDHIKVFKNKSKFILYTDDGINYTRKWIEDGIGCIAPHSMVTYNNGHIYLSEHGVVFETGSIYKDKGSSIGIISTKISNLLDYTPDEHRTAVGIVKDNKYWLSYPAKDTTYVYDFILKAWSIYDFAFSQATFYDTVHSSNIRPAKDLLFIKDDDDRIFKADTGTTDNGKAILVSWKSGPLGMSPMNKTMGNIGLYCDADIIDSTFSIQVYDAKGDLTDSVDYTVNYPYEIVGMSNEDVFNYFQIGLKNVSGTSDTLTDFYIDGIDIWLGTEGAIPIK